ncbi:20478_t:CDS:2 [Funneliformis geosporum]|nr:20478_t:CDS:2 [Funneliformis geosporum]
MPKSNINHYYSRRAQAATTQIQLESAESAESPPPSYESIESPLPSYEDVMMKEEDARLKNVPLLPSEQQRKNEEPDVGGWELFQDIEAISICFTKLLIAGVGLMYINNVGAIIKTLYSSTHEEKSFSNTTKTITSTKGARRATKNRFASRADSATTRAATFILSVLAENNDYKRELTQVRLKLERIRALESKATF